MAVGRLFTVLGCLAALWPEAAVAWGPLGHRTVAETAALLVQDDLPAGWGPILARHRFELGVYAYVPDSKFRHMDGNAGNTEAPTHRLYLDAAPGEAPGTVDRRAAQFLERARVQLAGVRAPKGGYVRGSTAQGDVRRIAEALYELGVMSHYTGDASMPYHATADWNGHARGEGGIHFYFENDCVNLFEPGLAGDVLAGARTHRAAWLTAWQASSSRPRELVASVVRDSLAAVREVSSLDLEHAVVERSTPGGEHDAKRKPAAAGCAAMRPLLVERLAKGAVLTAYLWESVLPRDTDLSGAVALQFSDLETTSDYVPPSD